MITGTKPRWQAELQQAITDPAMLIDMLALNPELLGSANAGAKLFSLRVPRSFVRRMRKGDPDDPLLRQILPLEAEAVPAPGFDSDPVGDLDSAVRPGLLHKYHGRVLLVTTGACAVNCRYCFRRHFPYANENPRSGGWQAALDYIGNDTSISEVILSGGDPLSLTDARLSELANAVAAIPHVRRLRIHTRQAVVLPSRIDDNLLGWLDALPLQKTIVVHINHANEIDRQLTAGLTALKQTGAVLFNQSVLLRGVNDSTQTLEQLSETLFEAGVIPYYLHLLDRVAGAAHFEVNDQQAHTIHGELRARLPGYLVPRLVREEAGEPNKTPVG